MNGHDGRRKPDHDWRVTSRCPQCGGPVTEMRINDRYARQEEHTSWCHKLKEKR